MSIDNPNAPPSGGIGSGTQSDFGQSTGQQMSPTETAQHDLDAVGRRASEDVAQLKQRAGEELGAATDKAKSFANDQKSLAAGQISGVASAIDRVANELDGSDQQTIARYARDLAAGLTSFGKTVEARDVDDLIGMAQDFGRRQPMAFLGAAALAGFVASRFAFASAHRRETKLASETTGEQQSSMGYEPLTRPTYGDPMGSQSRMGGPDVQRQ